MSGILFDSVGLKISGWLSGVALVFSFIDYESLFDSYLYVFFVESFLSVSTLFF